jgi:glucose-6-phosphate 1-epimerase
MSVSQRDGANGLPRLLLSHPAGSSAEIYLHGAHLTSWIPHGGVDALFLSRAAQFAPGRPIRGGVPVVFPQFAQLGPLPKHGFARLVSWRWLEPPDPDTATSATLELEDSAETRAIWPHRFRARLTVELEDRTLSQQLAVENTGDAPFSFTAALHSYFAVADLRRTTLQGLAGAGFEDRSAHGEDAADRDGEVVITGEIDRVYLEVPSELRIQDQGNQRALELRFDGFPDVVVWNPAETGTAALPDMDADEYRRMLCVEAAQVGRPVEVAPGRRWSGGQRVEVVSAP